MANPFYSSEKRYPLTNRPLTKPDESKNTSQDILNIILTLHSLLHDLDSLFLGQEVYTPPEKTGWITAYQTGAASYADATEQSILSPAVAGISTQYRANDVPAPAKLTAAIFSQANAKDYLGCGLCLKETATGKLITFGLRAGNVQVIKWTDENTIASTEFTLPWNFNPLQWYRIDRTDTDLTFKISADGSIWITMFTQPYSAILYDACGFWLSAENAATPNIGHACRLFSWRLEKLT